MAIRKITFEDKRYYHVFNRGVDKKIIFHDKEDLKYFLDRINDFNNNSPVGGVMRQRLKKNKKLRGPASQLVEIVAYCVLPNHFHLLLRQANEDGVTKFMQRLCTGYVMYYNKKYERSGTLFQGRFKAVELDGEGSLQILSVYVNLNYKHHRIDYDKRNVISSLEEYIDGKNLRHSNLCSKREIKNVMGGNSDSKKLAYIKYCKMQSKYFIGNKGGDIKSINFNEFEK